MVLCKLQGVSILILEKIDEQRLLIALTNEDMNVLDLKFDRLSWRDEYSRQIIKGLLMKAEDEIDFVIDDNEMMIESIPHDNGCFVLITLISGKLEGRKKYKVKEKEKVYLFEFMTVDDLLDAIKLLENKTVFGFKNTLVQFNRKYYLIVYSKGVLSFDIQSILTEFSKFLNNSFVSAARIIELGDVLVQDDAIKVVGEKIH